MKLLKVKATAFFLLLCTLSWSVSPTEFQRAALNGDTEVVQQGLKEKKLEYIRYLDKDHNTPLHLAACAKKGGDKADIISLLLKSGANANATNRYFSTPLMIAVSTNNVEGVRVLLKERGIQVNGVNSSNLTPLMAAIRIRSSEIIKLILSHPDLNPNQENPDGLTALHLAATWGCAEEAELLLKDPRTNPHPKQPHGDFIGAIPLHYAAMQARTEVVKLLLEQKGTNVHATIGEGLYQGFTPVHCAVMNPNVPAVFECLKLLFKHGAKVTIKSKSGKLPSDLTNVRVIQEFLADPNPDYELKQNNPGRFNDF
ncbi:ankyrin repeat domain-containing protein [Simkania sp.]|uniref:ankyrin repeat domain-containing protein n=1 Tax=Simkania sp. TaxID=34094 RepID=UPI003B5178C6